MAKHKTAPAAKFLLAIAVVIVLILIGGIILNLNEKAALKFAFVPSHEIASEEATPAPDYTSDAAWAAVPGKTSSAQMMPEGVMRTAMVPEVDVFYIHPTTYFEKERWNAPYDGNEKAMRWTDNFALRYQASAFNLAGQVYAPRYRQATFGAFFDDSGQGVRAVLNAHNDILAAFDNFIATRNKGRPFIIVGHSQGALHALLLLGERVSPTNLRDLMVAAYIIGWPVSHEGDLAVLPGIEACQTKNDTGCVVSYQSFDKDGDATSLLKVIATTPGLNGKPRGGTKILCTNPLNWKVDGEATKAANLGALELLPEPGPIAEPIPALTGARCGKDGILYLTRPPKGSWSQYQMAGGNYHTYDINLFYMNLRENAADRASAWLEKHR
ncbi:DUF3089 domain-containing protein [Kordiimonas lacus]|uniref:DUF3089 domain-containing protein n=1 Tax=Kordiimonas lacus TaxID=637679 RepID=A0A1G7C502_9PROT|nr:DUF3089 domain-containing protein [Kordiimonas lacus]SDE34391.1 Protein of unknown function [Kordiimonas lacus]